MKLKRNNLLYSIVKFIGRICLTPFFQLKSEGLENLPVTGAYVLLPKHQRFFDVPFLTIANPRPMYYVAKNELFTNVISKKFFIAMGGLPLNRRQLMESRNTFTATTEFLSRGEIIVVFPEGTYFPGIMGKGRSGVIRFIHSRIDTVYIPAGINYKRKFLRTKVTIKFGKPVIPAASPEKLTENIMKQISMLSEIPEKSYAG